MLTRFRVPVLGGAIALFLGVALILFCSTIAGPREGWLAPMFSAAVLYFLAGLVLGAVWPRTSWAWGAWLIAPLFVLLLLSLAFSGQAGAFLRHDLAPLLGAIVGALAGAVVGATGRHHFFPARA
jgi:peptidoglycan/LPS O-acetylase OafA/YrhL